MTNTKECYKYMLVAIIEQAIGDYKTLVHAGCIINGKVIDAWPLWRGVPLKVLNYYDCCSKVGELVRFFRSEECGRLMRAADIGMNASKIRNLLCVNWGIK